MKYIKPADQTAPNAGYVDANPAAGTDGSVVPAAAIEHPMREIVEVITHAGLTPDDEDLTQLRQAIQAIALAVLGEETLEGAFLPLAGGTMNSGAIIALVGGTSKITIAGNDVYHAGNDGANSGLDADLLDGLQAAAFGRKDVNLETLGNGKVRIYRITTETNRGAIGIGGQDGQVGGGRLIFLSGDLAAVSADMTLAANRRTLAGNMFSDGGATYAKQWEFSDDGDLWLRKLGAKVGDTLIPPGAVAMYLGQTAPSGWVKANGASLSRSTYARLWSAAQASGMIVAEGAWAADKGKFSTGDGTTTFRVPDLRGEFLRMWDDGRGVDSGRGLGTFQEGTGILASTAPGTNSAAAAVLNADGTYTIAEQPTWNTAFSSSSAETATLNRVRPRNVSVLPIIKV